MHEIELLDGSRPGTVGNQMPKLAEDIGGQLEGRLVPSRMAQCLKTDLGGVRLDIFVIGGDVDHPMPNVIGDGLTCFGNQLDDDVHIPRVIGGESLGENSDLEHQFLAEFIICLKEEAHEFGNYVLGVLTIASVIKEIEGSTADADIAGFHGGDNGLEMDLDGRESVRLVKYKSSHAFQSKVLAIRFVGLDILAQHVGAGCNESRVRIFHASDKSDGFKENSVGSVSNIDIGAATG